MAKTNGGDMSLAKFNGSQIADIQATVDLSELMEKIKQIKALKVALDACHRFRENAIRYAQLEAAALIRVVELGGVNKLKGHQRGAAKWLINLSEEERAGFIAACAEGLTIDQVWNREVNVPEKVKTALSYLEERRSWLIEDVKESGYVNIRDFAKEARKRLPLDAANDLIDGTRNALRAAGAIGTGFGSMEYVMPESDNDNAIKQALMLRYESIAKDIFNMRSIVERSRARFCFIDLCDDRLPIDKDERNALIFLNLALLHFGVITDEDAVFWDVYASGVSEVIKKAAQYCTKREGRKEAC